MHRWTPPKGCKVVFHLDGVNGVAHPGMGRDGTITFEERERLSRTFCDRFGLKYKEHGHTTIRLDDPRWPEMLDEIAILTERGLIGLRGMGAVWIDEPTPRASDKHAWFELSSGPTEIKSPSRVPGGRDLLNREYDEPRLTFIKLASDRFRQAVHDAGLTGLAFLPLEDWDGWHQVWATLPLGRGLDHPLVDPQKRKRKNAKYKPPEARHRGEPTAWLKYMWDDRVIDHAVANRLLELGNPENLRVDGPLRFVREHLPETDFAYAHWPSHDKKGPSWHGRQSRGICCNTRARQALLDAGVMKPRDFFDPMRTVPAAEANADILDRTVPHPLPLPVYTPEEAATELARREATRASRVPPPATKRLSLPEVEAELAGRYEAKKATGESALRDDLEHFHQIQSSRLIARLPAAWMRVLPLLPVELERDEGPEPFAYALVPPAWNDWLADEEDRRLDPDCSPSGKDIVIATNPFGDWFAIRSTDPLLPADAKVTWWDHETLTPHDEWPDVASFVTYIIEVADRKR